MILAKYLEELNKWYSSLLAHNHWDSIRILKNIEESLGLTFVPEKSPLVGGKEGVLSGYSNVCFAESPEVRDDYKQTFTSRDLLDYIYAILHSRSYRPTYKEFLKIKIDFPTAPYLADPNYFWKLVALGGELRQLHLLESPKVEDYITSYPIEGSNKITVKIGKKDWALFDTKSELGRIWINETQYFDKMPLTAWEFYIGGY